MDFKETIIYKKGINRRRLVLMEYDLQLLFILCIEQFLTEKQLYLYFIGIIKKRVSYPGFWKKLNKFEEYGLLKSYKYKVGQNGTTVKFFRLRNDGLKLLVNHNRIKADGLSNSISTVPKNLDHFFGVKQMTLNIGTELGPIDNIGPIKLVRGIRSKIAPKLIPDRVLICREQELYLEFDTGSETIKEVQNKVKIYLKELEKHIYPNSSILISLLDDSIPNKKGVGDRSVRIRNIYNSITNLEEFHLSWVDIYVLPLRTAQKIAIDVFRRTPLETRENILELMNYVYPFFKNRIPDDFWNYIMNHFGLMLEGVLIHDETSFTKFATVFLYMVPGSVRCQYNLERIGSLKLSADITTEIVYAIFRDKSCMEEHVRIFGAIKGVRYITFEDYETNDYQNKEYIYMKKTKNTLKKIEEKSEFPRLF